MQEMLMDQGDSVALPQQSKERGRQLHSSKHTNRKGTNPSSDRDADSSASSFRRSSFSESSVSPVKVRAEGEKHEHKTWISASKRGKSQKVHSYSFLSGIF